MAGYRKYRAVIEAVAIGYEITIQDARGDHVSSGGWALTNRGARRRAARQMNRRHRADARRALTREIVPDPADTATGSLSSGGGGRDA